MYGALVFGNVGIYWAVNIEKDGRLEEGLEKNGSNHPLAC